MPPLYDFECKSCKTTFEKIVKNDTIEVSCPVCGGQSQRQIGLSSFILKGDGWFKSAPQPKGD